jgi:homospermidine synthase
MLEYRNKVLFVGYGAVAQCALPILVKHIKVPARDITVMDFEDRRAALAPWLKRGVTFVRKCVTRDNMDALLGKYLEAGDLLIDLAWNIDCCEILQWCHDRGVLYVNTSLELWDPYENAKDAPPQKMTLYWRHMNLRRMTAQWDQPGPTAVTPASFRTSRSRACWTSATGPSRMGRSRARRPTNSGSLSLSRGSITWPWSLALR